jgi:hypothetical protein
MTYLAMMETRKISLMPCNSAFVVVVLAVFIIASSLLIPASNYLVYAHTFSSNESADFLLW